MSDASKPNVLPCLLQCVQARAEYREKRAIRSSYFLIACYPGPVPGTLWCTRPRRGMRRSHALLPSPPPPPPRKGPARQGSKAQVARPRPRCRAWARTGIERARTHTRRAQEQRTTSSVTRTHAKHHIACIVQPKVVTYYSGTYQTTMLPDSGARQRTCFAAGGSQLEACRAVARRHPHSNLLAAVSVSIALFFLNADKKTFSTCCLPHGAALG